MRAFLFSIVILVIHHDYTIQKLESGTIRTIHEESEVLIVNPVLREIAKK